MRLCFKSFFYPRYLDDYFYLVGSLGKNRELDWFFYKFFHFKLISSLGINKLFEFSNKFDKFSRFRFSDTHYSVLVNDSLGKEFLGYLISFYLLDFVSCFPRNGFKSNFFFGDYQKIGELDIGVYSIIDQFIPYFFVYSRNHVVTPNDFSLVARCFMNNYLSKNIFFFNLIFFIRRLYSYLFKFFISL